MRHTSTAIYVVAKNAKTVNVVSAVALLGRVGVNFRFARPRFVVCGLFGGDCDSVFGGVCGAIFGVIGFDLTSGTGFLTIGFCRAIGRRAGSGFFKTNVFCACFFIGAISLGFVTSATSGRGLITVGFRTKSLINFTFFWLTDHS